MNTQAGKIQHAGWSSGRSMRAALGHALLVVGAVTALFYHWFAVANRYDIFLYFHLGSLPFDARTTTRYLMAGLVAGGAVMALYILGNWTAGRVVAAAGRCYAPPPWPLVWCFSALPAAVGIVVITTTQNDPTLPLTLALGCAGVTAAALALALMPGRLAAAAPGRLVWLAAAGLGVAPCLLLLRAVELPSLGLSIPRFAYGLAFGAVAAGICWLLVVGWACSRWGQAELPPGQVFAAGACISYLLLPLVHHLFFTPLAHRYITVADNFFAVHPAVQALCLAAAAGASFIPSMLRAHGDALERSI